MHNFVFDNSSYIQADTEVATSINESGNKRIKKMKIQQSALHQQENANALKVLKLIKNNFIASGPSSGQNTATNEQRDFINKINKS